ncbi:MAG: hypothetical protein ABI450_03610, partial [Rhizomicrobium sp.]
MGRRFAALSRPVGHTGSIGKGTARRELRGIELALGVGILMVLFLAIALWNGFPLVFYDTGGYLAEGLQGAFLAERSPVYSLLLLVSGGAFSLWPVVTLQAALTAWLVTETARIEVPGLSLTRLIAIGLILMLATGIGWYTGQVEPDCMTAILVLGAYLLLFRITFLKRGRVLLIGIATGLAVACHPSHLGLMAGLLLV